MQNNKYRIYKAMIGWNVLCPCGGLLRKTMTWAGALGLAEEMIRGKHC